jgi:hypothetical protein
MECFLASIKSLRRGLGPLGVAEAHPFESEIGAADFASTCLWQVAGKCDAGGATGFARGTSIKEPGTNHL